MSSKWCPCRQRPWICKWLWGRIIVKSYSCKQCARSSLEIMVRTPNWLTQYNFCSMGSPERMLRLQRKVPWGSEESVLKHCLKGNLDGVKHLLMSGRASLYDVDPNHGRTPLHVRESSNTIARNQCVTSTRYKKVTLIFANVYYSLGQILTFVDHTPSSRASTCLQCCCRYTAQRRQTAHYLGKCHDFPPASRVDMDAVDTSRPRYRPNCSRRVSPSPDERRSDSGQRDESTVYDH